MRVSFVVFFIILLSSFLYSQNRLNIATIDLDYTLQKEVSIRNNIITSINRYPYLKQVIARTVDAQKYELFSTNNINIKEALEVASNLKVEVAIIIYSENRLKTNSVSTNISNVTNTSITNSLEEVLFPDGSGMLIEDVGITNYNSVTNIENNNLEVSNFSTNAQKEEDKYETVYLFKTVEVKSGDVLKENETASKDISSVISSIASMLEIYFSNNIFDSIESPSNDIILNFWIDRIDFDGVTNKIEEYGEISEGERFTLSFSVEDPGYVNIFAFQSDGSVIMLYPNDFSSNDMLKANEIYMVPHKNAMFEMIVRAPLGIDSFFAIYTKKKQNWISKSYFTGDGFRLGVNNTIAIFARLMRDKLKNMNKDMWQIKKVHLKSISRNDIY